MRFPTLFAVLFCLVAVSVGAQDLSEFENKKGKATVKTECFFQDVAGGDKEERLSFEHTRYYGVDGEVGSKISKRGEFVSEASYTHEFDKDGRVTKRTKKETWTLGKGPTHTRATLVWTYTYDDAGAVTVVCSEIIEEKKDEDEDSDEPDPVKELPLVETWKLDSARRILRYSRSLGAVENFRVEFERDEDGKLLTKTGASGELWHSKETYTYRDDGTLKESDEHTLGTKTHTKKQYGESGLEKSGQMVDGDGKTTRQWMVDRKTNSEFGGSSEKETIYKIYGEDPEKIEIQVRYVVTTTTGK
ncbi:MAG: hypothetical protein AAB345_00270 [Patescibacteria group bacterium]